MLVTVFWNETLQALALVLPLSTFSLFFYPEDGGTLFLQNVGNYLQDYTADSNVHNDGFQFHAIH
jgi:hypothetical protein